MNFALLVIFLASELLYYLLIAQTGIVEYFNSDILNFFTLPLGGIIGSLIVSYSDYSVKNKMLFFLTFQLIASLFYPDMSLLMLFVLGISVGAMAPLFIYVFKSSNLRELLSALAISYTIGTLLFTSDVSSRMEIAILFTTISMISALFLQVEEIKKESNSDINYFSIAIMSTWVFLDSSLFETLSRSVSLDIWRSDLFINIIIFHIVGVVAGFFALKNEHTHLIIWGSFILSYLFYITNQPLLLSLVYPFVISFYNVAILKELIRYKSLKELSVAMIFIGWIASGAGLFGALFGFSEFSVIFPIIALGYMFLERFSLVGTLPKRT